MSTPIPFAQGSYVSESLPISAQECVNFYPSTPQTGTVTNQSLFGTPGLTEIETVTADEFNRGLHFFNNVVYHVNATTLYKLARTFDAFGAAVYTSTDVSGGTALPGTERVVMTDNGESGGQMCIILPEGTNQFNAYIYDDTADTLTQISDGDFNGPVSGVVFIDGYFAFTKQGGNEFFISNLRAGLAYTATDKADAEADTDPNQVPFVTANNELVIFGTNTFEPFENVGGAGFPFVRVRGGIKKKGIDAINTIKEVDGNMMWLGSAKNEQPAIWASAGGKPQKISTDAIDNQLRLYTDVQIAAAFAVTYSQSGHLFVAFTIPGQETFVFDNNEAKWHTRESVSNDLAVPWRVNNIVEAYGELIVGDSLSNKIGIIDKTVFTEYGEIIRRRFVTPPIDNGGDPFFNNTLELVGESGVGLNSGTGSDPQILMSWSDNGGRSFDSSIWRSFGLIGEYEFRTVWNRLGRVARERMYKFEVSDPVKWVFMKVEVDID